VAACSGAASTPQNAGLATNGAATNPAVTPTARATSATAASPAAAGATADPVLANVLTQLNGLSRYQFKFTLKGGRYASSVGPEGVVGTVVNSPSFAVQFSYVDVEIIEIHGKNWTRNGFAWDLSPYPDSPTTYDSYGPAILNSMASYWGVKPGATLAGDIWIAKSGGYPVHWKVTGTGTDVFEFLVDITKANDAANVIAVPAS
jgi:hypothetical protein